MPKGHEKTGLHSMLLDATKSPEMACACTECLGVSAAASKPVRKTRRWCCARGCPRWERASHREKPYEDDATLHMILGPSTSMSFNLHEAGTIPKPSTSNNQKPLSWASKNFDMECQLAKSDRALLGVTSRKKGQLATCRKRNKRLHGSEVCLKMHTADIDGARCYSAMSSKRAYRRCCGKQTQAQNMFLLGKGKSTRPRSRQPFGCCWMRLYSVLS